MRERDQSRVLVLAAGRGVRAGGPKALLLTARGTPWWSVQAEALRAVGRPVTWVVSERVERGMLEFGGAPESRVLAREEAPMFASVLAGLAAIDLGEVKSVFVLPVDTPVPAPEVWDALARTGSVAAPAHRGKRGHPVHLPAPWAAGLLARIQTAGADPSALRLDELIAPEVRSVAVEDARVVENLNTMEDFTRRPGAGPPRGEDAR